MNKLEIVLFNIHYIAEKLGDNPIGLVIVAEQLAILGQNRLNELRG